MESKRDYMSQELEWIPENLPLEVWLFTNDTSKFAEAYEALLKLGLIPKPLKGFSRPLEEIKKEPNIGWQKENCLVLPVPGKEHKAPTDVYGWGIYRVVFREGRPDINMLPSIGLKYCFRHTPKEDFVTNRVLENVPREQHLKQLLQILNPTNIVDQSGEPL